MDPKIEGITAATHEGLAALGDRLVYVMPVEPVSRREDDELDFRAIWNSVRAGKWIVIGVSAVFILASLAYAQLATPWFRAEVLLGPAETSAAPPVGGQLVGLASLAGISLGAGNAVEPLALLRSREFAREFIEDLNLMPVLLADRWDPENQLWKVEDGEPEPDIRDAVRRFDNDVRFVSENKETGLVTVSIEWTDPEVAAHWADELVHRLNERMRRRAELEAEKNVTFLRAELAATTIMALQQTIGRLLESELQKLMLARGNKEFAFRVLDRAVPPQVSIRPRRLRIVLLGIFLGVFVSAGGVYLRDALARRRAR